MTLSALLVILACGPSHEVGPQPTDPTNQPAAPAPPPADESLPDAAAMLGRPVEDVLADLEAAGLEYGDAGGSLQAWILPEQHVRLFATGGRIDVVEMWGVAARPEFGSLYRGVSPDMESAEIDALLGPSESTRTGSHRVVRWWSADDHLVWRYATARGSRLHVTRNDLLPLRGWDPKIAPAPAL